MNSTKTMRVYWVGNAAGDGEWAPTRGTAWRLACRLYADPATKAPGIVDCYHLPDARALTRRIACALLSGTNFAYKVERDIFRKETP